MDDFSIVIITIRCVLLAMNLTGNSLVLITICKIKSLRGPTTSLLNNLAISDLTFAFGIMIAPSYQTITQCEETASLSIKWNGKLEFYTRALSSSLTLVAIAIERYLAVMKPFYHRVHVTKKRLGIAVLIMWIVAGILIIPGYFLVHLLYEKDSSFHARNEAFNFTSTNSSDAKIFNNSARANNLSDLTKNVSFGYEAFLIVSCTAVPAFLMGFLYGRIIYRVWFQPVSQQGTNAGIVKARRKLTKLLLIVTLVFYLCWLPLFATLSSQITEKARQVCILFPLVSTTLNPIIYSLHSEPFRQGVKSMFTSRMWCGTKKNMCKNFS